ncbi:MULTISPECIES: fumarylacetoacetate hydrolase family protein [unclassified Microbacterium]|uniref:fumarylacetoacetate hydrolase family protein n=1 Tax=unclassified Microbacterium TaxID=2609290 RepID=UPI00214AE72E|nr:MULTISPECIES: fumarylacetoacetate hydrolase family protein [unclassified Microbacterium]MCR2783289.1 fumarylacetoacetate hydrolase family protein [Microbacterium sp. zg.B96]MDL5351927.1 fumarylacetoacetate hydrolase family protein [Microbacterium sp. zg-YB36]WIM15836.1 fumarylacetoacetate hydrolase family protein [Microbacterium sp. zg-B96]
MRIANLDSRAVLKTDDGWLDIERSSGGRFPADIQALYERWAEFTAWTEDATGHAVDVSADAVWGAPTPRPAQVFAIGLNYQSHVDESPVGVSPVPAVFTKFPSSVIGPYAEVVLPDGGNTDWEAEVVVVIGAAARNVSAADAWRYVAGLTIGQDLSERILQLGAHPPQFSLGKSFPGFSPMGPELVSVDEFDNPDDLGFGCAIDGEVMQDGRTRNLIFSIPTLIEHLSGVLKLSPGDIIFTGTPGGVGNAREPKRFLQPGEVLTTWVEGIGEMRNTFRPERAPRGPAFER